MCFIFFKQKTADEMRISDWSSDVCSSDLPAGAGGHGYEPQEAVAAVARGRAGGAPPPWAQAGHRHTGSDSGPAGAEPQRTVMRYDTRTASTATERRAIETIHARYWTSLRDLFKTASEPSGGRWG